MIDLHTHTLFSDGQLLPSELVYRAKKKGYTAIGLTDHTDESNLDFVIPRIVKISKILTKCYSIRVIPGCELSYVPPELIQKTAQKAKKLGAKLIIVHGETVSETVPPGTNLCAVKCKGLVDILAHPGVTSEKEVQLAKKNNVCLEITTRKNHLMTNRHVAILSKKVGAKIIINTDTHSPEDLMSTELALTILKNAGLSKQDFLQMQKNAFDIIRRKSLNRGGGCQGNG